MRIVATNHAVDRARERGALPQEEALTLSADQVKRKLVALWFEPLTEHETYLDPDVADVPTMVKRAETRFGEIWLVARPNLRTSEIVIVSVLTTQQKENNARRRWRAWKS